MKTEAAFPARMPATFRDKRGEEQIEILTTGRSLATVIRGVSFSGPEFSSLAPDTPSDLFDFCHGDLCSCSFLVKIPVSLQTPEGNRVASIHAWLVMGDPHERGGLDAEIVELSLTEPEFVLKSGGGSGWFEGELLDLVSQLPAGFALHACITCGLSDYSPYGHSTFGCLACFRDAAEDYREVTTKAGIFAIWGRLTEYVQETYLCPCYELRPKGRGYRG